MQSGFYIRDHCISYELPTTLWEMERMSATRKNVGVQSGCGICPNSPTGQSFHSVFSTASFPFLAHVHATSITQTLQHPSHSSSPQSLAIALNHRIIYTDDHKISQQLSLSTPPFISYNLDFLIISKMSI